MAFLGWLKQLVPQNLHLFPKHWTLRQRKAGRMGIGLVALLLVAVQIWGVGVIIGYGITMLVAVCFVAWNEDERGKFED